MNNLKCDVCGDSPCNVVSSGLGAISFAYCDDCLASGAEPYGMLVSTIALYGGIDEFGDWIKETISATLYKLNISYEKFEKDLKHEAKRIDKDIKNGLI